ncbi:MAG: site-specific DNA-methyltransferase [Spirochaetaceae bacterium]|jgi:site-specific DNA-methyltransferase (adenine-specific)|nr:site-specific DNA-methyltransferase [Spirochaetaceae bacterium]
MNTKNIDTIKFICESAENYIPLQVKDNSVQLIYLDPPFFKQTEMQMYCKNEKTLYSFSDKWDSLDSYINFIKDILIKCKSKLSNHGLLFLHCDTSASHYLRVLLDSIFGQKNFLNEVIWSYRRWSNTSSRLLESHQNIFVYSKTKKYKFNRIMTEYSPTTNVDQLLQDRIRDGNGVVKYKKDENENIFPSKLKNGVPLRDVWEIPFLNPKAKERTGYPTQKPIELMSKIIKISCNKGDFILDPFCGSGSMGIAAYINNCKYLGIDKNVDAIKLCEKRKNDYYISQSAIKDGNYQSFNNLDHEIKNLIVSVNAIPIERNKGLDGIYSSADGLIGIRVQRKNESISETINLIERASKTKPLLKKIVIKTHDSDFFEIVPDDIIIIESLEYKINNVFSNCENDVKKTSKKRCGA